MARVSKAKLQSKVALAKALESLAKAEKRLEQAKTPVAQAEATLHLHECKMAVKRHSPKGRRKGWW